MSDIEDLLIRHRKAKQFSLEEARRVAGQVSLAVADVRNERAFLALDFQDLVGKIVRLGELQGEIIAKNRAIRELGDQAINEAGR